MTSSRIEGGLIDRSQPLSVKFDGRDIAGYKGDTLASALIANGVRMVGRSFKYHRPRGIYSAGPEEPNALVELGTGAAREPNSRATTTEIFGGLEACSQNRSLISLKHDFMAVNDLLAPFLGAGFYYKTFMWPRGFWEKLYEPIIRAAAGLGAMSGKPDPDSYDKGYLHCDLLVIGAGAAGLSAALAAGRSGARVILADEDFLPGGRLNSETRSIDDKPGHQWAEDAVDELASLPGLRLMRRTTVFGVFDHGRFGAVERRTDALPHSDGKPRQVLWRIQAKRSILCTGAVERPIAFPNNDRPGIMLAGAVRCYANRFGVASGQCVSIFTNNNDGWRTATDLAAAGVKVGALIDSRHDVRPPPIDGAEIFAGQKVIDSSGRHGLRRIRLSNGRDIKSDCLAISGGWNPSLHLSSHLRGRPKWDDEICAFVPGADLPDGMVVAGAANGRFDLASCLRDGRSAGVQAAQALGFSAAEPALPRCDEETVSITPLWHVGAKRGRSWVDFQNDVTSKDIEQAKLEGFHKPEHAKRYTTLGMGTDQGKTANVTGLAIMAELAGTTIAETGTTMFRPPYTPVSIGALAGRARGRNFKPLRKTPSHRWAEQRGAVFVEAGNWLRAQWFPMAGETEWRQSVDREVMATRNSVGICDVSTLGKIELQGRDCGVFLDHAYANRFSTLRPGRVRYGLMLREDGIAYDDGTTARLDETRFLMTTTTTNASLVFQRLEFARQCLWPKLDVHMISVTDGWAQYSVAGPNSRLLLEKLIDSGFDLSNEGFPFMACAELTVCGGITARLFRISFSGELAYEVAVPARYGESMICALMEAGAEFDATCYGTEALGVMRIEKGHVAGNELNGTTTARNLGLARMISPAKDCIGKVLAQRPGLTGEDSPEFIGAIPCDRDAPLAAGAHFVREGAAQTSENDEGWISSVAFSPTLGHYIGLGFLQNGSKRLGDRLLAADPVRGRTTRVEVVSPHFIDPEGERMRV